MLIYHFGTRDGLLREILGQARQRQVEAFTDLLRVRPDEPYPATLGRAWSAITGPHGQPYLRMFSRLHDTAGEPLWPGFRRTATTDWLAPLEEGMRSLGRPELATVVLAVIRGLLMDLDATGDAARTDRAFQDFLATIEKRLTTRKDALPEVRFQPWSAVHEIPLGWGPKGRAACAGCGRLGASHPKVSNSEERYGHGHAR